MARKLYGWVGDVSDMDVSSIKGNITREDKQILYSILQIFVGNVEKQVYGAQVGERLKCVEMNIWGEKSTCTAQTVFEVTVEKGVS